MFQLDYKSGVSICDQIVNGFIRMKALGILADGEQLPSIRALASQLLVNPNTIQKAYAILESNGIIYSVKGKGSFLSGDDRAHAAVLKNARENFQAAVGAAKELGLTADDLTALVVEEYGKKGSDAL